MLKLRLHTVGDNSLSLYSTFPISTSGASCRVASAGLGSFPDDGKPGPGEGEVEVERASQGERGTEPTTTGSSAS